MSLQDVLLEAKRLSIEERHELIKLLVDSLPTPRAIGADGQAHNLLELEGLGADMWEGIDAQEYVNQLRSEWDHRP